MSERQRIEQWIKGMERLIANWDRHDIQRWRKRLKETMPAKGEDDK